MTRHWIASREEWLEERLALLEAEKDLTRRSDALAERRASLPWTRVDKTYRFDTEEGEASLADLFRGRSQLIVYHFMFGPDYTAGCPSCSMIADGFNGFFEHLEQHDVSLWAVSRAPLDKILAFRRRMGWRFPWASSGDNGFNADFQVWFSEAEQRAGAAQYNYRPAPAPEPSSLPPESGVARSAGMCGVDVPAFQRERPGMSAFVREGGEIYHSYSTYSRGLDVLWGSYQWLDRAPLGRNENGFWWRRRGEYETE